MKIELTETGISQNTEIAKQFIETCWNQKNLAALGQFLADDYTDHAYQPHNRQGFEQTLAILNQSFPDHQHLIEACVAQEDQVVFRMRFQATHQGDFRGNPPTNRQVNVSVYRMYRIIEGRICDHWALFDTAALLNQIAS